MDLLRTFLIDAIFYFKSLLKRPDYKVIDRQLEYWVTPGEDYFTEDPFWERQSDEWDDHTETYCAQYDDRVPPPPAVVTKTLIRIKYWYNNRVYKYLTYDRDHPWPPPAPTGVHFNMPLTSAQLLDVDGTPVKDILDKIKRYAGPRGDFYGEKIKIADMFYFEEGLYPKVSLKNVFGMSKTVSTSDGYISDLRIP